MSGFVCVHGAFRGGWWFDRVAEILRQRGHVVVAPDLTGMGTGAVPRPADLTLEMWIDDVDVAVDEARAAVGDDIVLVGHSQGGLVIAAAERLVRDRVSSLVYLDAPVPRDGERGIDLFGPRGDRPVPPRDMWIDPIPVGDDSGLSVDDQSWVNEQLCSTPMAPSLDPVVIDEVEATPASYIFCTDTPEGYASTVTRARFDATAVTYELLESGHDVGLEAPALVADALDRIARA